jgi:transcriptional regulator of heat shock response
MDARQESFLKLVIEEYIATAEPVGSRALCEKYGLAVSPATVRNDMAALETEGYLRAPHTSAGRIPTEKAFVHYLKKFVEPGKASPKGEQELQKVVRRSADSEETVRMLANTLSELSGETVIAAFDGFSSHFAGVGNLFMKPDFVGDLEVVRTLSEMVNRFDLIVRNIFESVPERTQVIIGQENPFGKDMASVMVKMVLPSGHTALLGLVGPIRMDYARNIALLERATELLNDDE